MQPYKVFAMACRTSPAPGPQANADERSRRRMRVRAMAAALCLGLAAASPLSAGTIVLALEEPADGVPYSGITNLRGFAVSDAGISRVELYIDGVYVTDIPSGATRNDVADAYPNYPDSDKSGFSMAYNYGNLSAGNHTFTVRAHDADGTVAERSATFPVQKFHAAYFADPNAVNLDAAAISVRPQGLQIDGMTLDGKTYDLQLGWSTAAQGFRFDSIASTAGGSGPVDPPPGGGGCVNVPLVANGTRAVWEVSGSGINATVDTTYTDVTETSAASDTLNRTSASGITTETNTRTVQTYQITNNYLYVGRIETTGSASVSGFNTPVDATITYQPLKLNGPVTVFCSGQTWDSEPVSQTIEGNGQTLTEQTARESGEVVAVNEAITTAAGSFSTVRTRVAVAGADSVVQWIDIARGVMVKQETYDHGGALIATSTLKSLN